MTSKQWVQKRLPDATYKEDRLGLKFAVASEQFLKQKGYSLTGWQYKDGHGEPTIWKRAKQQLLLDI